MSRIINSYITKNVEHDIEYTNEQEALDEAKLIATMNKCSVRTYNCGKMIGRI